MKLLVVRHGVAMDKVEYQRAAAPGARPGTASVLASTADADDDFRPLTLEGIHKMKKSARGIASLVEQPILLVSSPLTRALQTAEILQERWKGLEILVSDDLRPGSKPQSLATWVNQRVEVEGNELIAITGHDPHLSNLVTWFVRGAHGESVKLKKGGACLIDFPAGPFERGGGVLEWLVTPGILRGLNV